MLNDLWQSLDPVIFSVGAVSVRWYGLAYVLGFLCAGVAIWSTARHWCVRFEAYDVLVFVCYCSIGVILGARLGYCLIYGDGYYLEHPQKIIAVWEGGMSFHGGLCGVVCAGALYAFVYHIPFLTLADLVAIAAPIGLFFGRCANFVNGELYGAETTWPTGVDFTGDGTMYHPSQLYEALLEGIVLFCILWALSRKREPPRPRGFFLGVFLIGYGIFRILIEFVRLPDEQIGYFFDGWGTMGQLLSLPMLVVGVVLVVWAVKRDAPQLGMPVYVSEDEDGCGTSDEADACITSDEDAYEAAYDTDDEGTCGTPSVTGEQ